MCFEPCRLIGQQRVGSSMGFIKSIAGKALHQVVNLVCFKFSNAAFFCALTKDLAVLRHLFWLFLTHRAA